MVFIPIHILLSTMTGSLTFYMEATASVAIKDAPLVIDTFHGGGSDDTDTEL